MSRKKSISGKFGRTEKEEGKPSSSIPLSRLLSLNSHDLTAIVGAASLAGSVGHNGFTALRAGDEAGRAHLPVGTTSLVASCLGYFTFRNSHDDTSLVKMPGGI